MSNEILKVGRSINRGTSYTYTHVTQAFFVIRSYKNVYLFVILHNMRLSTYVYVSTVDSIQYCIYTLKGVHELSLGPG